MKDFPAIKSFQVVQEEPDLLTLRIALNYAWDKSSQQLVQDTVARTVGPEMHLKWEIGENVTIDKSRKYRPVTSKFKIDLNRAMQRP